LIEEKSFLPAFHRNLPYTGYIPPRPLENAVIKTVIMMMSKHTAPTATPIPIYAKSAINSPVALLALCPGSLLQKHKKNNHLMRTLDSVRGSLHKRPQLMTAVEMSTTHGARNTRSGPIGGLSPVLLEPCKAILLTAAIPTAAVPTAIPKAANLHLALFRAKRMPTNGNAKMMTMTKERATAK
jgi:hypothetical protein